LGFTFHILIALVGPGSDKEIIIQTGLKAGNKPEKFDPILFLQE